jgi:hypothetical protein
VETSGRTPKLKLGGNTRGIPVTIDLDFRTEKIKSKGIPSPSKLYFTYPGKPPEVFGDGSTEAVSAKMGESRKESKSTFGVDRKSVIFLNNLRPFSANRRDFLWDKKRKK